MDYFEHYQSPYSWRYGSDEMRQIWGERNKRQIWREIWLALAEVQAEYGLVNLDQVEDLRTHVHDIDLARSFEIEAEIHHDLMAEIRVFAEQCPVGGGVIHLGATSADIEDNADVIRMRKSLEILLAKMRGLLLTFAEQIEKWADIPVIGFTHLQPAEPTTLGYRWAFIAQDLLLDWEELQNLHQHLRGKGFRGAVGSAASYAELFGKDNLENFEARLREKLNLAFFPVTNQTYPRKQDYRLLAGLAGLGATLYKFAFDLRLLQSPISGEISEPFTSKQVGSSAMPFKRNPINAEKIDSLARSLAQFPRIAWDNAAHALLERTLDDSANRRSILPEAFLIADELIETTNRILKGIQVDQPAMLRNLERYSPFASTERVLVAAVKAGADRQRVHECLLTHSRAAREAISQGLENPLAGLVAKDPYLQAYLSREEIITLFSVEAYIGDAPERARKLAELIRQTVS